MSLNGKTNEEKIWNYLTAKGLSACGAAGLMGNLYAESALNPQNLQNTYERKLGLTDAEYTAAVDSGAYTDFVHDSAGYGLAQWTYWSRKRNLQEFAKDAGKSVGDLETQLAFLCEEMSKSYATVWAALKTSASVQEASDLLLTKYERPANQGDSVKAKRAGFGMVYFEKYAGSSSAETQKGGNDKVGTIRMGHASISENGTIKGEEGDSTKKEVCVRSWYSKPWDFMAIHPDAAVREKHAQAVEAACANDNVGYSQYGRNSLYKLAKAVNFDISKVGPCNCDCSSLQNVAAVASGANVTYGSNGWVTSIMKNKLKAAGYKLVTASAYLKSADYCVRGAIYVKSDAHTVCGLDDGPKAKETLEKAGVTGAAADSDAKPAPAPAPALAFKIGDVVQFTGTRHYTSANAERGVACKPGPAKVTGLSKNAKHQYHLVKISGGGSTVYGWVDAADVKASGAIEKGDVVQFAGGPHYKSATATKAAGTPKAGPAKVTAISKGAKHPYHIIHTDKQSTVYGWVDADSVSK